ncbi:MAG: hypothetical protein ACE5FJ_01955 [Gemmatimonadales bacterium]
MNRRYPNLFITVVAVLFLGVDGVLLGWVGIASGSVAFILWSLVFLAGAGAVVLFYRKYMRNLDELHAARAVLRDQIELMRDAVRESGVHNALGGESEAPPEP